MKAKIVKEGTGCIIKKNKHISLNTSSTRTEQGFFASFFLAHHTHEKRRWADFRPSDLFAHLLILFALLVVGIICSVRHNNMAGEVVAHELASPLYGFRQFFVQPIG